MPTKRKNKNMKGKGILGDIYDGVKSGVSAAVKGAYLVGSKIVDPSNNLKYGEMHVP